MATGRGGSGGSAGMGAECASSQHGSRDDPEASGSFAPSPTVIVNVIVSAIERRTSAVDYVDDYIDDHDHVSECIDLVSQGGLRPQSVRRPADGRTCCPILRLLLLSLLLFLPLPHLESGGRSKSRSKKPGASHRPRVARTVHTASCFSSRLQTVKALTTPPSQP